MNTCRSSSPAISRHSTSSFRDQPERRFTAPTVMQDAISNSGPDWYSPSLRDLTGQVTKKEQYYFAMGGFADIYRAVLRQGEKDQIVSY